MQGLSTENNLRGAFEGDLKISNLTCQQSRNHGPSLDDYNFGIRPVMIMTKFVLLVSSTNIYIVSLVSYIKRNKVKICF